MEVIFLFLSIMLFPQHFLAVGKSFWEVTSYLVTENYSPSSIVSPPDVHMWTSCLHSLCPHVDQLPPVLPASSPCRWSLHPDEVCLLSLLVWTEPRCSLSDTPVFLPVKVRVCLPSCLPVSLSSCLSSCLPVFLPLLHLKHPSSLTCLQPWRLTCSSKLCCIFRVQPFPSVLWCLSWPRIYRSFFCSLIGVPSALVGCLLYPD